jgi:hypothetical protein
MSLASAPYDVEAVRRRFPALERAYRGRPAEEGGR